MTAVKAPMTACAAMAARSEPEPIVRSAARKNGYAGPCCATTGQANSPVARRCAYDRYSNESSLGVRTIGRSHTRIATRSRTASATPNTIRIGRQPDDDPVGDVKGDADRRRSGRGRSRARPSLGQKPGSKKKTPEAVLRGRFVGMVRLPPSASLAEAFGKGGKPDATVESHQKKNRTPRRAMRGFMISRTLL